ncbi:MAG: Fpg/Nei family DNA glycosylase [Actinobacteria bacterium]|nr:MAG: Fpg/Nei family DNA glycosylase [Actinomycetota bacterium]
MPELPDVEGFRRTFARHAANKTVSRVEAVDRTMTRKTSPRSLARALARRRFRDPYRHGKLLICPTGGPALVLHFGMTGSLEWSSGEPRHRHDRLVLVFADGELRYRNMRKFGGIWLARDPKALESITGRLGPDWLEVSPARFRERLGGRRSSIKAALMDQKVAAGLGNLTADEALWQARIDPRRRVSSLDEREEATLYRKIQKVLRDSLPHGLVPAKRSWLTGSRDHRGGSCPRCGTRLERTRIGGRTTVFCPREQS